MKKIIILSIFITSSFILLASGPKSKIKCDSDEAKAYICSDRELLCFVGKNTSDRREKASDDKDCEVVGIKCVDKDDCDKHM